MSSPNSVIGAIGNIGPDAKKALPLLVKNLKVDPTSTPNLKGPNRYFGDVRIAAIEALGKMGPAARNAIGDLEELKGKDPSVRDTVDEALDAIRKRIAREMGRKRLS